MESANFDIIQDMYHELKNEQTKKLTLLKEKKNRIAEIDAYLNSLLSKEESDLRVFLPRKVEDVYQDVIEKNRQEKEKLLFECDDIDKQIHIENKRIAQLEKI